MQQNRAGKIRAPTRTKLLIMYFYPLIAGGKQRDATP